MRKRTLGLLALCILVLLVLSGYFFYSSGRSVQIGMHKSEVVEILGGPGLQVKYRTNNEENTKALAKSIMHVQAPPGAVMVRWELKNGGSTLILFDRDDIVVGLYEPRWDAGRSINMMLRSVGLD